MRVWVISLAFLSVFGCVRLPEEEAHCLLLSPPSVEQITAQAEENNLFKEGDFPDERWLTMFDQPQLTALIEHGLCNNPHLQAVQERVEASIQEAKVQRSRLFPTIGANAEVDWEYLGENNFFRAFTPIIPGNITEYELNVELTYEFDFWGKNRNIYRAALGREKSMIAEKYAADLLLSTTIAAHYFKLQAYLKQVTVLEKKQKVLQELFYLTKKRVEHALDNTENELGSNKDLLLIGQQLVVARKKVELEKHFINMLVGLGPEDEGCLEEVAKEPLNSFSLPTCLSTNLIARRPDLIAQIHLVESTAHLVGAAKADFYPRINLCSFAGLSSVFFSKLFTAGSRNAEFEPALYLPIFTAGRLKARLKGREAQFREMIYNYNETVLRAVREVADYITQLNAVDETLNTQEALVVNRLENRDLERARYEHALSNLLDVYTQEIQVLQEELIEIKLFYKKHILAVELIKALGGGYCDSKEVFDGA